LGILFFLSQFPDETEKAKSPPANEGKGTLVRSVHNF